MFWADQVARDIIKKSKKDSITIATGIAPSGPIHVGNLREVMTADAVRLGLEKLKTKEKFLYIADDFDPLRKVYPFLPKSFEKHVHKPLSNIPDPEGKCHKNYAEHFLSEFFESIEQIGIKPKILYASQMYKTGKYTQEISSALKNKNKIKKILKELFGREVNKDWSPFNPLCKKCGKLNITKVEKEDLADHKVFYSCKCGYKGWADYSKGEGKLFWRIDWPARWKFLEVDFEAHGKDLAASGGAFEGGERIIKEIFKSTAPMGIYYEFLYLIGTKGKMSSSLGNVVTGKELLEIVPPEIIRFILLKTRASRHINFNPGKGLVQAINEFNCLKESKDPSKEQKALLEYTIFPLKKLKGQIPFVHLSTTVQAANFDLKEIKRILSRTGYKKETQDEKSLKEQVRRVKNWLRDYAPENLKFEIQKKLPEKAKKLSSKQKKLLSKIVDKLKNKIKAEKLHNFIYDTGKALSLSPTNTFQPIYWVLLDKDSGPKAGWFLSMFDKKFLIKRFKEAIKS